MPSYEEEFGIDGCVHAPLDHIFMQKVIDRIDKYKCVIDYEPLTHVFGWLVTERTDSDKFDKFLIVMQ